MPVKSCCSMQCVNRIHPNAHNVWSTIFCSILNTLFAFIWALKISFNIVSTVLNKLHAICEKDKLQQLLTNFKLLHKLYSSVVLMCSLPSYLMWDCLGKNCCAHCSCSCQNRSYLCRSVVSLQVLKWWFEIGRWKLPYTADHKLQFVSWRTLRKILLHLTILRHIQYCHFFLSICLCIWVPEVDEMFFP